MFTPLQRGKASADRRVNRLAGNSIFLFVATGQELAIPMFAVYSFGVMLLATVILLLSTHSVITGKNEATNWSLRVDAGNVVNTESSEERGGLSPPPPPLPPLRGAATKLKTTRSTLRNDVLAKNSPRNVLDKMEAGFGEDCVT